MWWGPYTSRNFKFHDDFGGVIYEDMMMDAALIERKGEMAFFGILSLFRYGNVEY